MLTWGGFLPLYKEVKHQGNKNIKMFNLDIVHHLSHMT